MDLIIRSVFLSLLLLWLLLAVKICSAQESFNIKSGSATYDLDVRIDKCDDQVKRLNPSLCTGSGRVSISHKGSTSPFQILNLKGLEVDSKQLAYNSEINKSSRKLYDDEYSFIFGDFNFDGREDLAVRNGRKGGYGAPSYNVYLFNVASNRFVENVRLSRLTEGAYLGLFFLESKKQQLLAYSKSGCCYHETEVYKVISNRPVLVEQIIKEAFGADATGYNVVVTTRKLVNGRWAKRIRKHKTKGETP